MLLLQFVIFFQINYLSPSLTSNFMVLVPKSPYANMVEQSRPIVLGNFLLKLSPS